MDVVVVIVVLPSVTDMLVGCQEKHLACKKN